VYRNPECPVHKSPFRTSFVAAGFLAAVLLLLTASPARAQLLLHSGPERVALLELYTSQGCSSCPPADRWLSRLVDQPGLWNSVVPVAFHVDYWDYIGWRDPFSRSRYSQRQREYAREGGLGTVYTPGVLLNGREWRDWRRVEAPRPETAPAGTLTVERDGRRLKVRYLPADSGPKELRISVALLGCGLTSAVTAGENRGRRLENDFVVLDLRQAPLEPGGDAWTASLNAFEERADAPRLAVAAWVSTGSSPAPLQAAGGWLK